MEIIKSLSRRDFLKLGFIGAGALAVPPIEGWQALAQAWPDAERLGRVCVGKVPRRTKPTVNSPALGDLYEDAVVVWLREVIGEAPTGVLSRRWIETPDGYIYAPSVQPVKAAPNQAVSNLPTLEKGKKGMWVEVTTPYVDLILDNPPGRSPWTKENKKPRLYYSQIMWVDDVKKNSQGQVLYRVNERFGTYGDIFWASGDAFRPLTSEELEPIHPGAADKRVVVDVNHQVLSCYEGTNEVYFCRISSGAKFNAEGAVVENWATPAGEYWIWRKLLSIHMAGGTVSGGYDLPGIAWTCLFKGDGVAIHSTFWHNDYGTPRSHGCVNANPEDAKWIFRWTEPFIGIEPGDLTVQNFQSSKVKVIEG